jgi:hypothetical protein
MNPREQLIKVAMDEPPNSKNLGAALAVLQGKARPTWVANVQGLLDEPAARVWTGSPSRTTFWRWRKQGLRMVKIGGRVFYKPSDLQAFVDKMAEEGGQ